MAAFCSHHCRGCGSHFTSLRAFDLHRQDGRCEFPDSAALVEFIGVCAVAEFDPETAEPARREGVTVYQLAGAESVREQFAGMRGDVNRVESPPALTVQRKTGVAT